MVKRTVFECCIMSVCNHTLWGKCFASSSPHTKGKKSVEEEGEEFVLMRLRHSIVVLDHLVGGRGIARGGAEGSLCATSGDETVVPANVNVTRMESEMVI